MRNFAQHIHNQDNPWDGAPAWAIELRFMLALVLTEETIIMSQNDDLNNAVTALATGFAALDSAVGAELAAIVAAGAPNPVVAQAIANIGAITGKMATDAAALTASIPSATTVPAPTLPPSEVSVPPKDVVPDIAAPPITAPDATPPNTPPASAKTVA